MTVNTDNFYSWQRPDKKDYKQFKTASPNILAIKDAVQKRWGGTNLGIYGEREIRSGGYPSTHSFGAAWDWRYKTRAEGVAVIKWLVANSKELGIQAVHDYYGCTIWRSHREAPAERGWLKQKPDSSGMGAKWAGWLHIETTKSDWANATPVHARGVELPA